MTYIRIWLFVPWTKLTSVVKLDILGDADVFQNGWGFGQSLGQAGRISKHSVRGRRDWQKERFAKEKVDVELHPGSAAQGKPQYDVSLRRSLLS